MSLPGSASPAVPPPGRAARALAWVDATLATLASASILLIMAITGADVFLRYVLNRPIAWAYDVISLYLVGAVFFFSLSDTFAAGGHVSIDLLVERVGERARRWMQVVWCIVSATAFAPVFWLWLQKTLAAWRADEIVSGAVDWPVWLSTVVVPVGTAALLARLVLRVAQLVRPSAREPR